MALIGLYRYHLREVRPADGDAELETSKVGRGQIVEITSATISDFTTTNRKLSIGLKTVDGTTYYLTVEQSNSTRQTHINGHIFLVEGDCLVGAAANTNAGDVLSFSVHGKIYDSLPKGRES